MNFRPDINGLRAWAVVPVVLFHFGVAGFSGGFVGVDIFFVISGFLMTGIIVPALTGSVAKPFSLLRFYLARAMRIWPALMAVCSVVLLLGWFGMTSLEYESLAKHVKSSLLFHSNHVYWREAGYFDADAHEKWLLHTWSLSVEWQFYLILPLILMLIWRLTHSQRALHASLWLGLVVSFGASLLLLSLKPSFAFYGLPSRAWEMLAGGLVFMLGSAQLRPVRRAGLIEALGWVGIVGSVLVFDQHWAWPGWFALLPVLGACMVLAAANARSWLSCHPVAQWLGTRSYSLYLWHWPVVVALRYTDVLSEPWAVPLGLSVTVLLSMVSHRWVETWGRERLSRLSWQGQTSALVGASLLLVSISAFVMAQRGVSTRLDPAIERVAAEQGNVKTRRSECLTTSGAKSPACVHGGPQVAAVVLGDSHADAVTTAVAAASPTGMGVVDLSYTGCPVLFDTKYVETHASDNKDHRCAAFQLWVESYLQGVPRNVPLVIVNRAAAYALGPDYPFDGSLGRPVFYFDKFHEVASPQYLAEFANRLTQSICRFAAHRPVYVVKPIPEMNQHVPKFVARGMILGQDRQVSRPLAEHLKRHAFVIKAYEDAQKNCGAKLLDPYPWLCPGGLCAGMDHGMPLYHDDDHLSGRLLDFSGHRLQLGGRVQ
ncbi:MAG: acyltransferase family protein, partial [Pseudomonadota bacterium]